MEINAEGVVVPEPAGFFAARADESRVRRDVDVLARAPRGRRHHPAELAAAETHVAAELRAAGWDVATVPFQRRWVLGVSDAGGSLPVALRLRVFRRLAGVNLVARLPGAAAGPSLLVVAHLDSVARGPGADDNASGVAVLLECARLLAEWPQAPAVTLAVVDMEELGKVGSTALARDASFRRSLRGVLCLESVGFYSDAPGSQKVGAVGLVFPAVARAVRAGGHRGDFLLAVCRRSSLGLASRLAGVAGQVPGAPPVHTAREPRRDGLPGRLLTALLPFLATLDRSDHAPFWHRGVPSVLVTTTAPFRNPEYHLAGDLPQTLDVPRMTALAAALAATCLPFSDGV